MKAPRFFLAAAVLFWGWQVHLFWIAIFLGIILESANVIKSRFDFQISDFNKFIDISTVFLAGTIVIALTIEAEEAIFILLKWIPLIFFPIIAAQYFSTKSQIDIQSFFLVARKKRKIKNYYSKTIDISYIYTLFCILSAGTANSKGYVYYISVAIFFIWALWHVRSKRCSSFLWITAVLFTIIFGFAGHNGMRMASVKINQMVMEYYDNYYNLNPFKTFTAMGEITKLKLSDKIIFRTSFDDYTPGKSYLLHNASYNRFAISNWFITSKYEAIEPARDNTSWQINPSRKNTKTMTAYFRLLKNRAVLSLPAGVVSIAEMKTGSCEKNTMQSVRIEDGPSLIKCVVSYTDELSYDIKPYNHDLLIPKKELAAIRKIARELGIADNLDAEQSNTEILKIVKDYFLNNFTYSLDLKGKGRYKTPLINFLNNTKAGHCEFFATATVLLLRQANIPARYVTGYIAHEYSRIENQLIVRQRDAHAWVKVFINGQWKNFDTTPPSFLITDSQTIKSSLIEDLLSFVGFKLSQLRHETGTKLMKEYGLWLTLPLGLILFFRLKGASRIKRVRMQSNNGNKQKQKSNEISFYLIEMELSNIGFPRHEYETYFAWIERIGYHFNNQQTKNTIQALLRLHNKNRFSNTGLSKNEQKLFNLKITTLLKNQFQ
ncbi:transglutaminase-like domain-containing protein [Desulfobacterales bacterium HSG17]|nr:transglutaminase-like domain-containing protein [Desulfobacterales bacterium HSG17]